MEYFKTFEKLKYSIGVFVVVMRGGKYAVLCAIAFKLDKTKSN
jgi:hypothetical protein